MYQLYDEFLIYSGEKFAVYFHAESVNKSKVYEYYLACDLDTKTSLYYLVKRIADFGHIYDETKFRIEDSKHKIYCFKPKSERFFSFFFIGRRMIITSAYTKMKQKLDWAELKKAILIKDQYSIGRE